MAAGSLSAPGTDSGPCLDTCKHTDCAANRRMAALPCTHCGKPIGYEPTRFFRDGPGWDKLIHSLCFFDRQKTQNTAANPRMEG